MKFLHTMIRVNDLDEAIKFYCDVLGMKLLRKREYPSGKFTLAFVGYGDETSNAVVDLTYNRDTRKYDLGIAFGRLVLTVGNNLLTCDDLRSRGAESSASRSARRHHIAFIEDPTAIGLN